MCGLDYSGWIFLYLTTYKKVSMKNKILIYGVGLLSAIVFTASSCKKTNTEEQLPPETHEGKFTFGCKVNGVVYTARGKGGMGLLSFGHVGYTCLPHRDTQET